MVISSSSYPFIDPIRLFFVCGWNLRDGEIKVVLDKGK